MRPSFFSRLFTAWARWRARHLPGRHRAAPLPAPLDRKLLRALGDRRLPGWAQLKYLRRFFKPWEARLFAGSLGAALAAVILIAGIFLRAHLVSVPEQGGEYTEALVGQPKLINPLYAAANEVDADLAALIYRGLYTTAGGELLPDLAERVTVSPDYKTYQVELKSDVRWSDGEAFTADDVVFTWEMIRHPDVGSPWRLAFDGVRVEKIDDQRVRFITPEPFAPFLSSLTVGILPEHLWGGIPPANFKLAKYNLQPVGTGRWQFGKLAKDDTGRIQSYTLAPNSHYRAGDPPYLEQLTFKFYPDIDQAQEAQQNHAVQAISFYPRRAGRESRSLVRYPLALPEYVALFLNSAKEPTLKSDAVRRALAQAVDKLAIVREALQGYGEPADAPLLSRQLGYHKEIKRYPFAPEESNKLLDSAWRRIDPGEYFTRAAAALMKLSTTGTAPTGTPPAAAKEAVPEAVAAAVRERMPPDQAWYRADQQNRGLNLTIATLDLPEYAAVAEAVAKAWRAIGINTEVKLVGGREFSRAILRERDYAVLLYGEVVGFDPDLFAFWHSSQISYPGLNLSGFGTRLTDQLLEDGRRATSTARRAALYQKFQDELAKELPAIFLYYPVHLLVIDEAVKGVTVPMLTTPADRYAALHQWYLKTKWRWRW